MRIYVRYTRARVGRWTYDGKAVEADGSPARFTYTDRRGNTVSTTRFTPLD
ncbi:hypothetical protein GCM10020000_87660 [Streptomyces olivoverticillatus]